MSQHALYANKTIDPPCLQKQTVDDFQRYWVMQENALDEMRSLIANLVKKAEPFLTPEPPCSPDEDKACMPTMSPSAQRMMANYQHLMFLYERLHDLYVRLDV